MIHGIKPMTITTTPMCSATATHPRSLVGNPRCVFLDEPTTGVDPESRRFMWTLGFGRDGLRV